MLVPILSKLAYQDPEGCSLFDCMSAKQPPEAWIPGDLLSQPHRVDLGRAETLTAVVSSQGIDSSSCASALPTSTGGFMGMFVPEKSPVCLHRRANCLAPVAACASYHALWSSAARASRSSLSFLRQERASFAALPASGPRGKMGRCRGVGGTRQRLGSGRNDWSLSP